MLATGFLVFEKTEKKLMSDPLLARIVGFGIMLAIVVVVLGAYTRLVDAGLGCPDWPGCYGFIGVPDTQDEIAKAELLYPNAPVEPDKAWPEMVHRYFATGLGALCVALVVVAYRRKARLKMPLILLGLVVLQGAFGAWTVTLKLWPQVVTAHLLGGFATLSLLFLYWLLLKRPSFAVAHGIPPRLATFGLVVLVFQIGLGGWVSSNYAALSCPDFPLCHGQVLPSMDLAKGFDVFQRVGPNYLGGQLSNEARVAIQVGHRVGAFLVLFVVGMLVWRTRTLKLGQVVGGLLLLQFILGISNVVFNLPLVIAVMHNAGGGALLLGAVALNFAARNTGKES